MDQTLERHQLEIQVRRVEEQYDRAWQRGDIDTLLDLFTSDAQLISPRGDIVSGTSAIRALFKDFLGNEAKGSVHQSHITQVSFVSPLVAVVDGEVFIEGLAGQSEDIRHHRFTDILVYEDEQWRIAHIRAYPYIQPQV